MARSIAEVEICTDFKAESFRTSNEWWFVAVCQSCGTVVSSITCGGDAIRKLDDMHLFHDIPLGQGGQP